MTHAAAHIASHCPMTAALMSVEGRMRTSAAPGSARASLPVVRSRCHTAPASAIVPATDTPFISVIVSTRSASRVDIDSRYR